MLALIGSAAARRAKPGERAPRRVSLLARLSAVATTVTVAVLLLPLTVVGGAVHMLLRLVNRARRLQGAFERLWFWVVLHLAGVEVRVHGQGHLERGRSYIIMPNHRSWFDVPALHWALGHRDVRWVGKKEIVRVPFFGWAFGLSRHIEIDRRNREKAISAIRRAAEVTGAGVSIVIFPEGTRSYTQEPLPFKKGGFHLALDTGLEILPVAVAGTERVMRRGEWTIRPGKVDVIFCEPVASAGRRKADLPLLMETVRERIRVALSQPTGEEVT